MINKVDHSTISIHAPSMQEQCLPSLAGYQHFPQSASLEHATLSVFQLPDPFGTTFTVGHTTAQWCAMHREVNGHMDRIK
jgi:hypothetical protein